MNNRRWAGRVIALVIACVASVFLAGFSGFAMGGCSILRGKCDYDPRTQVPNILFIEQPPESFVVQYIKEQIKQNGTFPPAATSPVTSITPVQVKSGGFYTDWHVEGTTWVEIGYADGTLVQEMFDTMAGSTTNVFGIEQTSMHSRFHNINECENPSAGHWVCR